MFARVNEFQGTADQLERSLGDVRQISQQVETTPGSLGMYYLIDRDAGKALAITLWEDEKAMADSEESAGQIRRESTQAEGLGILGVGHYEVAFNTARVTAGQYW